MVLAQLGGPTALLLLACPVSMGAMMWFMMRGMPGSKKDAPLGSSSLADLKDEQARLAAKIQALEPDETERAVGAHEPTSVA